MIVDIAIVIAENTVRRFEQGDTAEDAAIHGTKEMILPILASTLTTFAAFSALLFMGGTFGKFVKIFLS